MEIDTTGITVDKRQGASVTYYDAYVTPQLRVESYHGQSSFGVTVQIMDKRNAGRPAFSYIDVRTAEHPREVTRQFAAVIKGLEAS